MIDYEGSSHPQGPKPLGHDITWGMVAGSALLGVALYGFSYAPTIDRLIEISSKGFSQQNLDDFLVNSPLLPLLAALFSIQNKILFAIFCLSVSLLILASVVYYYARTENEENAKIISLAIVLSPSFIISLAWMGMYDLLHIAMTILMFAARSRIGLLLGSLILGFNHTEQALVLLIIVTILEKSDLSISSRARSRDLFRVTLMRTSGLLVGAVVLKMYHSRTGSPRSRAEYIEISGVGRYLDNLFQHSLLIPISGFGALTVPVLLSFSLGQPRQKIGLAVTILFATVVTIFTLDSTRVMSVLVMPVVLASSIFALNNSEVGAVSKSNFRLALALAIVWPRTMIWDGKVSLGVWDFWIR